jgi:hypothetical protein
MPGIRRALPIGLGLMGTLACASAPPPAPRDRYSPADMRSGPSLHETGRFGVTPISSSGTHIEDARPQATGGPLPSTPAAKSRRRLKRRGRAER